MVTTLQQSPSLSSTRAVRSGTSMTATRPAALKATSHSGSIPSAACWPNWRISIVLESRSRRDGVSRANALGDCQLGGWRASPGIDDADPFDWLSIAEGPIAVALGTTQTVDRCIALPRTLMRWAMRAHMDSHSQWQRLTQRLSSSLDSVLRHSADATLFCANISPLDRAVYCASVGHVTAIRLHESGCQVLVGETRPFAGPGLGGAICFL